MKAVPSSISTARCKAIPKLTRALRYPLRWFCNIIPFKDNDCFIAVRIVGSLACLMPKAQLVEIIDDRTMFTVAPVSRRLRGLHNRGNYPVKCLQVMSGHRRKTDASIFR